jgi:hypothetical protein
MDAATYPDGYGSSWTDARCHICPARFDSVGSLNEHIEDEHIENAAEQERRWAALDASVPCSHTIPGTCDYCGGAGA